MVDKSPELVLKPVKTSNLYKRRMEEKTKSSLSDNEADDLDELLSNLSPNSIKASNLMKPAPIPRNLVKNGDDSTYSILTPVNKNIAVPLDYARLIYRMHSSIFTFNMINFNIFSFYFTVKCTRAPDVCAVTTGSNLTKRLSILMVNYGIHNVSCKYIF